MITVALTGSTGFVGQAVTAKLRKLSGLNIIPLSSISTNEYHWDVRYRPTEKIIEKIKNADILLHLAAKIPSNYSDLSEANSCNEVNGLGIINLIELANKARIKRLVYVSTANVLGRDVNGLISNQSRYDCKYAVSYLASKALGELYFKSLKNERFQSLIVRPSSLYSEEKPTPFMCYVRSKIKLDEDIELYDGGAFASDYLHLQDFSDILVKLCLSEVVGEVNVGTGIAVSNLKIAQIACEIYSRDFDKKVKFIPGNRGGEGFGPVLLTSELKTMGFAPLRPEIGIERIMLC
jgi:UDP-glucose 4-epimerase